MTDNMLVSRKMFMVISEKFNQDRTQGLMLNKHNGFTKDKINEQI